MTQRRKGVTKTMAPAPSTIGDTAQKCYCYRCGVAYGAIKGNFAASRSPMYRVFGYLPICNDCVDDIFNTYMILLKDKRAAMRRVCMKFDLYWNDEIFEMTERQQGVRSFVRKYIGKTNLNRFAGKCFDDTIEEEAAMASRQFNSADTPIDAGSTNSMPSAVVDFWGPGFDTDFYLDLERRYKEWTDGVDVSSPSVRSLYKQICILEARINKGVAAGDSIKDDMNLLNTVLGNLALKPSQQQKGDDDAPLDKIPFGVGIGWCEQHKPISEPAPEFKDVDGIVHYITAWFYGHLAKMVGKKNIKSQIYDDEIARWTVRRPRNGLEDDEYLYEALDAGGGGE